MKHTAVCGLLAFACFGTLYVLRAADTDFEVASIKVYDAAANASTGLRGGPGTNDPGQITWHGGTMRGLLINAYGIDGYEIAGPAWIGTQRYSITAKVPPGTPREALPGMWQRLLAQRFGLQTHRETKDVEVYSMEVGAKGSKLSPSLAAARVFRGAGEHSPESLVPTRRTDGCPFTVDGVNLVSSSILRNQLRLCAQQVTTTRLASELSASQQVDRPVIDQTGLTGRYDFKLEFLARRGQFGSNAAVVLADNEYPLDEAIQKRLGLKLVPKTLAIEMLVLDQVNRVPSDN